MLPLIQQLVIDKGWLEEEEAIDCIAISQSLPGILAVNAATYIGKRLCGLKGSIVASVGCTLPSFIIIITIAAILGTVPESAALNGAFMGVKAAVCGLVVVSAVRLGKNILKDPLTWILMVVTLAMVGVFDIAAQWAIIMGGIAGVLYQVFVKGRRDEQ